MTKRKASSTATRRVNNVRPRAKGDSRVLPNARVRSSAETRLRVVKRTNEGGICYTDHKTGDIDHMNAHIRVLDCAR